MKIDPVFLDMARVLLAHPWDRAAVLACGHKLLGRKPKWWAAAVEKFVAWFPTRPPTAARLARLLAAHPRLAALRDKDKLPQPRADLLREALQYQVDHLRYPDLPKLATPAQLADWLNVPEPVLRWLADIKCLNARQAPAVQNYRYHWVARRRGGHRLIEAPKEILKRLQRQILDRILDLVPPHDVAHGFRAGRSILTHAAPHTGQIVVIKFDLKDYFPSVAGKRVGSLFRWLGYPDEVAWLLTCLCTTITPAAVEATAPAGADDVSLTFQTLYRRRHLPQGAPTSPAVANLCTFRLDRRLSGLAAKLGARYTRYADDLLFSGDAVFARKRRSFIACVYRVILEEGFQPAFRKTRVMARSTRQLATGLILNETLNVPRPDFDELKAILHNAMKHGLASQNRAGHPHFVDSLRGRIAFVSQANPRRGAKLKLKFEAVLENEKRPAST
ncbi:reverse transcriptase family protein [Fimbriiglobus ruber]|uniref:RNA-directed DNA polymerase n=1 Tax=Fimbriiglobus ruber TaxID=1908690 RepID=A0A225DJM6_9BACT|nr:reverse transcriptase family protein [Fimbriiglobus ruber]OWK36595.1 Retron-type RNA-directed DNA polymerase [Fimbriiglobus ruber]